MASIHGGDVSSICYKMRLSRSQVIDASASLCPRIPLRPWLSTLLTTSIRDYPDRSHIAARESIGRTHSLGPDYVLLGNGASELITWVAYDAATAGRSLLLTPGFADYERALKVWGGNYSTYSILHLPFSRFPQSLPRLPQSDVVWITNPHNPTGHLWSYSSLLCLLKSGRLIICDESFLPLVPGSSSYTLAPLIQTFPNLIVLRSLTKLCGIAGLRFGYVLADPSRLKAWASLRDPWPVNSLALEFSAKFFASARYYNAWIKEVSSWTLSESLWYEDQFLRISGLSLLQSSANYALIRSSICLSELQRDLLTSHRILVRDCSSFEGLSSSWMRIGYQSRAQNIRIVSAIKALIELSSQ